MGSGCAVAGLCGTAADSGSGVRLVELSLRRSSTGLYWNGSSFGASTETFRPATRSGSAWSFAFPAGSFPADGGYVVGARVST